MRNEYIYMVISKRIKYMISYVFFLDSSKTFNNVIKIDIFKKKIMKLNSKILIAM